MLSKYASECQVARAPHVSKTNNAMWDGNGTNDQCSGGKDGSDRNENTKILIWIDTGR